MALERPLPTSSYVILGLVKTHGPMTPYELKKAIDSSVGYFWEFPRAQLYVDPERLVQLGLLTGEREAEGRRRRTYHITDAGLAVLQAWLHEPTMMAVELRDMGLLKLFFGALLDQEDVVALAQREYELHRQRLHVYERYLAELSADPSAEFALATVHMGIAYERSSLTFWADIIAHPPTR